MRRTILLILLIIPCMIGYSQRTVKVSSTYTYYVPETMSVEDAKRTAVERAKIQAIADEFGTYVSQSVSSNIINNKDQSSVNMLSTGLNEVRGEWIIDLKDPQIDISYKDDMLIIKASVLGKAREISRSRIIVDAKILRNQADDIFESTDFITGDDLYLSFQSPSNGYLLVYLIDYFSDSAFCLLPYATYPYPYQKIENDKKYYFFSLAKAEKDMAAYVEQYNLTLANPIQSEHNDLIIIFSPNEISKINTIRHNDSLPRQTNLKEFRRWLESLYELHPEIQVITKTITINT